MTTHQAKAEAKKIVERFSDNGLRNWSSAKQIAIIHVNGLIDQIEPLLGFYGKTKILNNHRSILTELEKP